MFSTRNTEVFAALARAAAEIQLRLAEGSGDSLLDEPYSPIWEADHVEEVDRACERLAEELARREWGKNPTNVAARFSCRIAELVLLRIRDAQRFLRANRSKERHKNGEAERVYRHLLVNKWHSYAEPYWLERMAQHNVPIVLQAEAA